MKRLFLCLACSILICNLVGCSKHEDITTGHAEGRLAYISSPFGGFLKNLFVTRGDQVQPGQRLFALDEEPESFYIKTAQADIKTLTNERNIAQSILENIDKQLQRREQLAVKNYIEKENLESYRVSYKNDLEQLNKVNEQILRANTSLNQAKWSLSKKNARAEKAGIVFDTYFLPGEYVVANQPIVSILSPDQIYIVFFVDTEQLAQLQIGRQIHYSCDGTTEKLPARISYISPHTEFTPPVLYGKDLRANLSYRIEALAISTNTICLHPGQPLDIYLK